MNVKRYFVIVGAAAVSLLVIVALLSALRAPQPGATLSLAPASIGEQAARSLAESDLVAAPPQSAPALAALGQPGAESLVLQKPESSAQSASQPAVELQPVIPAGLVTHPPSQQAASPDRKQAAGAEPPAAPEALPPDALLAPRRSPSAAPSGGRMPDLAFGPSGAAYGAGSAMGAMDAPLPSGVDLELCLDTQRVWGVLGAYETITVTVNGVQMGAAQADGIGFFWTTLYDAGGYRPNLVSGDALEIYHDGALAASLTLQEIQAEIDAQTETVTGVLDGVSSPTGITLYAPGLEPSMTSYSLAGTTDAGGNFNVDMSSVWNFSIWDVGEAAYTASGVEVHRHMFPGPGIMARPAPWNWAFGTAAPGERITATLYTAGMGIEKDQGSTNADGNHFFFFEFGAEMLPTDILVVEYDSGGTRDLVVEPLSISMDPASDTISGFAPPGAPVRAELSSGLTPDGYKTFQVSGAADGSGAYTLDFSSLVNILPDTTASVFLEDAEGDELNVRAFATGMVVNPRMNEVYGHAATPPGPAGAGYVVTATVDTGGGIQTARRLTEDNGSFYFNLSEDGIDLLPGMYTTVTVEGSPWSTTVHNVGLGAGYDVLSNQIFGTYTPPSDRLDIDGQHWVPVWEADRFYPVGGIFGTWTSGDGTAYTAGTPGFDLRGNVGLSVVHRKANENGEQYYLETDHVRIWPQYNGVVAAFSVPQTTYTLTLRSSQGDFKAEVYGTIQQWNGANWSNFGETGQQIEPGDSLQVRSSAGYDETYVIPDMDVFVDGDLDQISGHAPANSLVHLEFNNQGKGFAPTSANGEFLVRANQLQSFDGTGDVQWGDWGNVCFSYSTGSTVCENYNWPQITAWYNMVGDSQVYGYGAIPGNTIRITVTHPVAGDIAVVETSGGACDWCGPSDYWVELAPGTIEPGNLVTVNFGDGYADSIEVSALTALADVDTDILTGTAPPDSLLNIHVSDEQGTTMDLSEVPVDGGGNFTVNVGALGWDIYPGHSFYIMHPLPRGHQTEYHYFLPAPNLSMEKWNAPGVAEPGGTYLFQLRYHNDGNGEAGNTTLVDVLPPGTSYYAHTGGFPVEVQGERITLTLGTLPAWFTGDIFLAVSIDPGLTPGSQLSNNCVTILTPTLGDPNPGDDTACTSGAWVNYADAGIWLRKWPQPSDPTPGENFDYIIEYGSNGSSASAPVWLTDTLPAGASLVSWMDEWGWTDLWELYSYDGEQVVFFAPAGVPGDMGGHLRLTLALDPGVELLSAVKNHAIAASANDEFPWDNEASEWARTRLPRFDLRLDYLDSSGSLVAGGFIDYWMGPYNAGNSQTSARITATLPTGLSYENGSSWVNDDSGGFRLEPVLVSGNQVVWQYPSLGVNRNFNISFRSRIDGGLPAGTVLQTCAQVAPDAQDGNPADNARCHTWQVNSPGPNLRIAKSMPQGDNNQDQLYYELQFYNLGSQTISNAWITDTLPAGTNVNNGWWNMNFDWGRLINQTQTDTELRWQLSELYPGDSGSFQIQTAVNDPSNRPQTYTNQAEISTPAGDVAPDDNSAEIAVFRGEVYDVQFYVDESWLNIWGSAIPGSDVLLETPSGSYAAFADPNCGGCWGINEAGALNPGEQILLSISGGVTPLVIDIPSPLDVAADPATDAISGQVGVAAGERLHVYTRNYIGQDVRTTAGGQFSLAFPELPESANGELYYEQIISGMKVTFIRRYFSPMPQVSTNTSHDWVQGRYEVGHTAYITVTGSDGATTKATAIVPTWNISWWGGEPGFEPQSEDWFPAHPDIQPSDWVKVRIDDGPEAAYQLGEITGVVSAADDRIDGTALAPWISQPVLLNCHTWGSNGSAPNKWGVITLDGASPYACAWDPAREWDLQPNMDIGVEYVQPDDHSVFAVFVEPSPHLAIDHQPQGSPGEGGNLAFRINYVNQGGATASDTVITQTLQGMSYLVDTSGIPHTTGVTPGGDPFVRWELGSLPPGPWSFFDVFVSIDVPASGTVASTVKIDTSAPFDAGEPGEKTHTWSNTVSANDTAVNLGKWPWTGRPTQGDDFIWVVQPCNNGSTSSSELILTDTLPVSMTLNGWWANTPGWQEVTQDASKLVLSLPSLNTGQCSQVYLRFTVAAEAVYNQAIMNHAWMKIDNDLDPTDNAATSWINVGLPYINLSLSKDLSHGQLTPGGVFAYNLNYSNNANLLVSNIFITDTLPANTTLREIRHYDYNGNYLGSVTNYTLVGNKVSWPVGTIENGYWGTYQVELGLSASVPPGTPINNTAEITRLPGEDNLIDNQDTWNEVVQPHGPNLRVTKWRTWNDVSGYNYQIQFNNIGDQSVQNVWITDVLPANTVWNNWWGMGFDWGRLTVTDLQPGQLRWRFSELYPGDSGWIAYNVRLDGPDTRPLGYTNTVSITTNPEDTNLLDNTDQDVVWRAGVDVVDVWVADEYGSLWGNAPAGTVVNVQTPLGSGSGTADPNCGGCWSTGAIGAILPGDRITVTTSWGGDPLILNVPAPFTAQADGDANTVSGQSGTSSSELILNVYGGESEHRLLSAADGTFSSSFLDIPNNSSGEMRYDTTVKGATVRYRRRWYTQYPKFFVNYSHEWVQGQWEAGRTLWITVTSSTGTEKAHAQLTTRFVPNWGGDRGWEDNDTDWQWLPARPDIQIGDWVHVRTDAGDLNSLQIGEIQGVVNSAQDRIDGVVIAPWIGQKVQFNCHPWGGPPGTPGRDGWLWPDGTDPYSCAWDPGAEWDVLPGQEIGVEYYEPDGNSVMAAFHEPAPYLRISKWTNSNPGEGGGMHFFIQYQNDGDALALAPVISDTLEGMLFLFDMDAGYLDRTITAEPGEPIVVRYEMPDLAPGESRTFSIFAEVAVPQGNTIINTAQISTASPFDAGDPSEKISSWSGTVNPNDTQLNVGKNAWTGDPYPGETFAWQTTVCNNGSTASGMVTLTDTLPDTVTLLGYDPQDPGWRLVSQVGQQVVLDHGSLPNNSCTSILWHVQLHDTVQPGEEVANTVTIQSDSDLTTGDDTSNHSVYAGNAHTNLNVNKWWAGGSLTAGGQIRFHMSYQNNGNVTVANVVLTDTLPVSTTLVHLQQFDYWWRYQGEVNPTWVDGRTIRWDVGTVEPGFSGNFEIALQIDPAALPGTELVNTLSIIQLPGEDNPGDNQAVVTEMVYPHGPNVRLRRGGSWDNWGINTRRASLWMNIENIGDQRVENVVLVDEYPLEMTLDGFDTEGWRMTNFGNDPDAHVFSVVFQYLEAGESTWFNHGLLYPTAPMPFGLQFSDTAHVIPVPGDTNPADDSATVVLTTGPDLYVEKSLESGSLQPGETLTFRLQVGNDHYGHEWWWNTTGSVWVIDNLPVGLEFLDAVYEGCGWCSLLPDLNGQEYRFNLGQFGSSHNAALMIIARVSESVGNGALLTNSAEIYSDQPGVDIEPDYENNFSQVELSFTLPVMQIGKLYESNRMAGEVVTYTLSVTNTGAVDATSLVVKDTLPVGLTYSNGGGDGVASFDGTDVTWTVGLIPSGEHATLWFSAVLPAGGTVTNDSYRVTASDQGVTSPNGAPVSFEVIGTATLDLLTGWNLITLPLDPQTAFNAETLLLDINSQGGACNAAYQWLDGNWQAHDLGSSFRRFPIALGGGYFVRCNAPSSWTVYGLEISTSIELTLLTGWNGIGIPYPPGVYNAETLLLDVNSQGGSCDAVYEWVGGNWSGHNLGSSFRRFPIEPDKGYFMRCNVPSGYTPTAFSGAPVFAGSLNMPANMGLAVTTLFISGVLMFYRRAPEPFE